MPAAGPECVGSLHREQAASSSEFLLASAGAQKLGKMEQCWWERVYTNNHVKALSVGFWPNFQGPYILESYRVVATFKFSFCIGNGPQNVGDF